MINLKSHISLYGPEWAAIKQWLQEERELRLTSLLSAKTHEDSQRHRGAVEVIDKLLRVEKDAARAASN